MEPNLHIGSAHAKFMKFKMLGYELALLFVGSIVSCIGQDLYENAACDNLFTISSLHEKTEGYCVSVSDGDTFKSATDTIRLIGVDAPELNQYGGRMSQEYLARLILDESVILVPGSKDRDNYKRLLRYVYVNGVCVNEELIRNGYAEARYLPENDLNREYYIQLEMETEIKNAGLWRYTIFQPRLNLNWEGDVLVIEWWEADQYYGLSVIVEGIIIDTYNSGKVCFLDFHTSFKDHLSAVIFACDFPGFPEKPETYYLGKKVQIIGIIRMYKGRPEIIVKTPAQIKVFDCFDDLAFPAFKY